MEKFTGFKVNRGLPTQYSWTGCLDEKDRELLSYAQKSICETTKNLLARKAYEKNLICIKAFVQGE